MAGINVPANLIDEVRALRREVQDINKKAGLASASITRGRLRVAEGASFLVEHMNGLYGILLVDRDPNGRYFVQIRREDGTIAFDIASAGANQFWALRDRLGFGGVSPNIVVSDDAVTGWGLASPKLPIPMHETRPDRLPATTISSYEEIFCGGFKLTNPYIAGEVLVLADGGTTGQVRLLFNGAVKWESPVFGPSAFLRLDIGKFAVYPGQNFGADAEVSLEAKRISGGGNVRAGVIGIWGEQS